MLTLVNEKIRGLGLVPSEVMELEDLDLRIVLEKPNPMPFHFDYLAHPRSMPKINCRPRVDRNWLQNKGLQLYPTALPLRYYRQYITERSGMYPIVIEDESLAYCKRLYAHRLNPECPPAKRISEIIDLLCWSSLYVDRDAGGLYTKLRQACFELLNCFDTGDYSPLKDEQWQSFSTEARVYYPIELVNSICRVMVRL